MKPLVSVVVVTYNHYAFIEECLDSILSQKVNFEFEILIGEDDSNDGTREICMRYAKEYPDKIKLILRDRKDVIYINNKPTGRFNFIETTQAVSGKYIALCEGDDYWINSLKLQIQVDFLEENWEYAGAAHNALINGVKLFEKSSKGQSKLSIANLFGDWILPTASLLFRREALDLSSPLFTQNNHGDFLIAFFILKNGHMHYEHEFIGSYYRLHEQGVSKHFKDDMLFLTQGFDLFQIQKIYPEYKELCLNRMNFLIKRFKKNEIAADLDLNKRIAGISTWSVLSELLRRASNKLK
jgi:glycosyltransferase involved in cell wall biosynthesis